MLKNMLQRENESYVEYKGNKNVKSALRRELWEVDRDTFDETLPKTECACKRIEATVIENTANPK